MCFWCVWVRRKRLTDVRTTHEKMSDTTYSTLTSSLKAAPVADLQGVRPEKPCLRHSPDHTFVERLLARVFRQSWSAASLNIHKSCSSNSPYFFNQSLAFSILGAWAFTTFQKLGVWFDSIRCASSCTMTCGYFLKVCFHAGSSLDISFLV